MHIDDLGITLYLDQAVGDGVCNFIAIAYRYALS
jgi:hypothetical protein